MTGHTAGIVDVFADARQVAAGGIRPGDYVFTPTGARRAVTRTGDLSGMSRRRNQSPDRVTSLGGARALARACA